MKDLNIVIVNWKSKNDIEKCLRSLEKELNNSGLDAIVQIIDNSSNADGIKEFLINNYPEVNYIDPGENLGFGRAQNLGFKKYPARFFLPLNPDIEFLPEENVLACLIKFLEDNHKIGIASPQLLNLDGSIQQSCFRFPNFLAQIARRANWHQRIKIFKRQVDYYLMEDFKHDQTVPVDWIMGSFMLVRKELTDKIGFFDDRYFMYFEDCDWCRRSWQAGCPVYYFHEVKVKHRHRRESAEKKAWKAIFTNKVAQYHLKSWWQYFRKWGIKKEHFGR